MGIIVAVVLITVGFTIASCVSEDIKCPECGSLDTEDYYVYYECTRCAHKWDKE